LDRKNQNSAKFLQFFLKLLNFYGMGVPGLRCFRGLRRSVLARRVVASAVYGAHLFLVVAVTGDRVAGDGLLDAPQVLVGKR
jgi:hypothetical protein